MMVFFEIYCWIPLNMLRTKQEQKKTQLFMTQGPRRKFLDPRMDFIEFIYLCHVCFAVYDTTDVVLGISNKE